MKRLFPILALAVLCASCSTTRVLGEGEYRLVRNDIAVEGEGQVRNSDISPYIRQSAQTWSPLICIYNWSGKDGLWHRLGTAPAVYDSTATASSLSNIATHMEYMGYYGSRVSGNVTLKGKKARVRYTVHLGKRYRIDSLIYDIPPGGEFPADFRSDSANTGRLLGEWLSESLLEQESGRSAGRMRDMGYFSLRKSNYSFEADTFANGSADLIYRIREYTRNETEAASVPLRRFYIDSVNVTRPASLKFSDNVLRGLNTIHHGDLYSETRVNDTYSRLSALKLFSGVQVQMTPKDTNLVDCDIALTQSQLQGFKVNMAGSVNSTGLFSLSPQFSYFHRNIFHGGEWLNLGFSGDFQYRPSDKTRADEFGISASVSFPRFLGLPYSFFKGSRIPRTEVNASFSHQNRPEYSRSIISTSFGYTGTNLGNISYQFYPMQVNFVRLYDLDPVFEASLSNNPFMRYSYLDHLDAGAGGIFYYNTSPDIVPQDSYMSHRLSVDLSGNLLALLKGLMPVNEDGAHLFAGVPYAQYVRGEYAWSRGWRFGGNDKQAVALRLLAGVGLAYGNSTAMPFEKQFYAGGASSMRGWQARALGPGSEARNEGFVIPSQTGDFKLEANLEYRFGLISKLEGALFSDVGNVWTLSGGSEEGLFRIGDFYKTVGADWGIGLRLNLTFILLRLDFGMKLYDPALAEGSRLVGAAEWLRSGNNALHFGIGYPF